MHPSPYVARTTGAVLLLLVAAAHVLMLAGGFRLAAYIGVWMVLGLGLALAAAATLAFGHGRGGWWFALAVGALNAAGHVVTRRTGFPAITPQPSRALWSAPVALVLLYSATLLTMLAVWCLWSGAPDRAPPPRSAEERHHPESDRRSEPASDGPQYERGGGGGDQP